MRLRMRRGSVLRMALLLGLIIEILLPSGALLAAGRAASVGVPPYAHQGHDAAVADSLRHEHGAVPRDTAGSPPPSADATSPAGTSAAAASTPLPLPQAHHHPHPLLASNAGAIGETLTVPFTLGPTGVSTVQSYLGPVTITVSGVGQADGSSYSDAFYIYTDGDGNSIDPIHFPAPDFFYDWSLWISGGPADYYVPPIPAYDPSHVYTFAITAPGGPLTFAVGDTGTGDNTGTYTITVTRPTGTIPWHPHHTVRFSDHLSASVDLADGHVDVSASDLSIPGRGPDLSVNHVWDSALAQDAVTTTAGQGWVSSLTPSTSGVLTQTVFFNDQTGATWPFSYTGAIAATGPYTSYLTPTSTTPTGRRWS